MLFNKPTMEHEVNIPRQVRQVVRASDIMAFFGKKERMSYKMLAEVRRHYKKLKSHPVTIREFCDYYRVSVHDFETSLYISQLSLKRR